MYKHLQYLARYLIIAILISSCSPLISPFDHYSYTQTTSLKVDVLNMMSYAIEDYSLHEAKVKAVELSVQKQIEYEKHRPKNEFTNGQWTIINNPEGHLFGGFLKEWNTNKKFKQPYVDAKKDQVSRAFDEIIKLESRKIK